MNKNNIIPEAFHPGEYIRDELDARNWTQVDLSEILGLPRNIVSDIITGRRLISTEIAIALGEAFDTSAQIWLNLQTAFQISIESKKDDSISRKAKIFDKAPIREMQNRGWIEKSSNIDVLENQVCNFLGIENIDSEIELMHAARKSDKYSKITNAQLAWLTRAKQLAERIDVKRKYNNALFEEMIIELKEYRQEVNEISNIPDLLSKYGIRFLIIEQLTKTKIDGACFWLNDESPVIVLSLRFDRIDCFWHSLVHELGHIKRQDGKLNPLIETQIVGEEASSYLDQPIAEKKADIFAVNFLINQEELEDFILSIRPLYSKRRIALFSMKNNVHQGIVVGQLQYRKEILYSHHRGALVKVREVITKSAPTDGWGMKLKI